MLHGDISKLVKAVNLSKMTIPNSKTKSFLGFLSTTLLDSTSRWIFFPFFGWLFSPVFAGFYGLLERVSSFQILTTKTKKL